MIGADSEKTTQRPRRWRMRPPLVIFWLILAGWWCATIAIFAVDPYDIYPWGLRPKLSAADYSPSAVPYLADVAAKNKDIDLLLIGSSPTIPMTRAMMKRDFPGVRNPFNLSYGKERPVDRELVTEQVLAHTHAKRVILTLDWPYQLSASSGAGAGDAFSHSFPTYLYDDSSLNDIRMVGGTAIQATLAVLTGRDIWVKGWSTAGYNKMRRKDFAAFQTQKSMAGLSRAIELHRSEINLPSNLTCNSVDAIGKYLVPFARSLSKRGIELDILIPTYSLAFYYWWLDSPYTMAQAGGTLLNDQLVLRRCVVDGVDGLPGVRVFAFDNDDWITADLANYKDTGHIFDDRIIEFQLKSIASGSHILTKRNVGAYINTLRARVVAYQLKNSRLGIQNGRPR